MNLKEHNDNRYTKEKNEVESYLMRIIQRYFEIEDNYSRESIEAIIVESLTRFKEHIIKDKGFIFSLNFKTGHLNLTIDDFSGEPIIDKESAFNKDFGINADTICEGNDPRLYDKRTPTTHVHDLSDITGLKKKLEAAAPINTGTHYHSNKTVLDVLKYSGTQATFDLLLLESLESALDQYMKNVEYYGLQAASVHNKHMEKLSLCISDIQDFFTEAKTAIEKSLTWIESIKKHVDEGVANLKTTHLKSLNGYATDNQAKILMDFFKKTYSIGEVNEINIPDSVFVTENIEEEIIGSESFGYTNIVEKQEINHSVTMVSSQSRIKLYFRYNKDGNDITVPLPFYTRMEDESIILITGQCTGNTFAITCNTINKMKMIAVGQYDNSYIAAHAAIPKRQEDAISYIQDKGLKVVTIDSEEKNNYFASLLTDGEKYFINALYYSIDNTLVDFEMNALDYSNWDTGQPDSNVNVVLNSKGKWSTVPFTELAGFVAEFTPKRLSEYFNNPRIYYEVLENREV